MPPSSLQLSSGSAKSEDPERERARKFLAPAFSNMNLQKIAPLLIDNIKQVFNLLDTNDKKNQPIEMGQVVLDLIIGTLTKSSFEVEFNLSTHPHFTNTESIDATSFLHELEVLIKERMLQLVIPFRYQVNASLSLTLSRKLIQALDGCPGKSHRSCSTSSRHLP